MKIWTNWDACIFVVSAQTSQKWPTIHEVKPVTLCCACLPLIACLLCWLLITWYCTEFISNATTYSCIQDSLALVHWFTFSFALTPQHNHKPIVRIYVCSIYSACALLNAVLLEDGQGDHVHTYLLQFQRMVYWLEKDPAHVAGEAVAWLHLHVFCWNWPHHWHNILHIWICRCVLLDSCQ